MTYVLHYAPDNASLIVRLALEHRGLPYRAALVDRRAKAQESADFRALNPNGLIPVLETPEGPLFETGAILLYLADRHGGLGPGPDDPARGDFLKWLFFLSNTIHPALRRLFYSEKYIAPAHVDALRAGTRNDLAQHYATLEIQAVGGWLLGGTAPTVLDFYTAALLRWPVLYPADQPRDWFTLAASPALARLSAAVEALPATHALQCAEGLGDTPFTAPRYPQPPEGSAT
ncbi:Glutathione S-transferase GST-4.5 [Sulfitobacter indolifex]|uniref:Glutathione S-transferase family protein n=1 Tax=Sulfitobacter indolifex HEL-45 TaxID=391624 RepID=A0ABP2DA85_9RHOB|nr:glutathione S-transferase family protein [Sulfitobacter indolifex]EDQ05223.1 glutathione S-transferase family protein [Sulfitobacter indolifex HEL-45]UOA18271.1 Glutathione S-transferase GST-4.5 [Sulfitobacter indolifex]